MRVIIVLLLAGCASKAIELDELLHAWVGHDFDEIVEAWGPPTFGTDLVDGERVYTWRDSESYVAPNNNSRSEVVYSRGSPDGSGWNSTTNSGITFSYWCDKSFTVNAAAVIIAGSWRGNACD